MKRTFAITACVAVVALMTAVSASAATVYNNDAGALPGNLPSLGYEATATSEFGGEVGLAGGQRKVTSLRFMLSTWGCQSGTWNANNCATSPGAKFPVDVTAKVYAVGPGGAPGSLLTQATKTLSVPYRPSASKKCTGPNAGKWYKANTASCFNGKAVRRTIALPRTTVPDEVIVSLAYNTTHYGYNPIGESAPCYSTSGGCGYDSLNVALDGTAPAVGTQPRPDDAYLNSVFGGNYCDGGSGGTGTFRLDAGCWTGFQPVYRLNAN